MSTDDPNYAVYTIHVRHWGDALALKELGAIGLMDVGFTRIEHSAFKIPGATTGYAVFFVVKVTKRD